MDNTDILKEASKCQDMIVKERRYLHRHPELSGLEFNTVKHVKEFLDSISVYYEEVPDGGILAFFKGNKPGKTVLLRGDMDALPIQENPCNTKGPKECVSLVDGVSHACGHDAHTAMLMAVAKILSEQKPEFPGTIILMFERGEENTENILKIFRYTETHNIHIDSSFAVHTDNTVESGKVAVNPGNAWAGSFSFNLNIKGHGGHGSRPDLADSPIECFRAIHNSLSDLRMQYISPFEQLTFAIGCIQAGGTANAIPDLLNFKGTVRFYSFNAGKAFKEHMIKILDSICPLHNCTYDGYISGINRATVNNAECAKLAKAAIGGLIGLENVLTIEPSMGNETMGRALLKWPGVYMRLGTRNPEKGSESLYHTSEFDIDEDALKYGAAAHLAYAFAFLNSDIDTSKYAYKGSFADMLAEEGAGQDRIDYFSGKTDELVLLST